MQCCAAGRRLLLPALVTLQTIVYGCGTWFQVQTCLMCAGSTADSIAPPIFTTQLQFRHQSATMPVMGYKLPAEVGALAVTHVGAEPRRSAALTRFVLRCGCCAGVHSVRRRCRRPPLRPVLAGVVELRRPGAGEVWVVVGSTVLAGTARSHGNPPKKWAGFPGCMERALIGVQTARCWEPWEGWGRGLLQALLQEIAFEHGQQMVGAAGAQERQDRRFTHVQRALSERCCHSPSFLLSHLLKRCDRQVASHL